MTQFEVRVLLESKNLKLYTHPAKKKKNVYMKHASKFYPFLN